MEKLPEETSLHIDKKKKSCTVKEERQLKDKLRRFNCQAEVKSLIHSTNIYYIERLVWKDNVLGT